MPKRIVDGDCLWKSHRLNQVTPVKYRSEIANLIPLALVNGSFEADPRLIWAQVYSYNRPDVSMKNVESMLNEFERVKILFRWTDENGKVWGHWVGSLKPGRAVPQSQIKGSEESRGPHPPMHLLTAFMGGASLAPAYAQPTPGLPEAYLSIGVGSGLGSGVGKGEGSSLGIRISNVIGNGPADITPVSSSSIPLPSISSSPVSLGLNKTEQTKDTSSAKTEKTKTSSSLRTEQDSINEEARQLTDFFYDLVQYNPNFTQPTKNWEHLWPLDFTKLREDYSLRDCKRIIVTSQFTTWKKYVLRPLVLLEKLDDLEKVSAALFREYPDYTDEFDEGVEHFLCLIYNANAPAAESEEPEMEDEDNSQQDCEDLAYLDED